MKERVLHARLRPCAGAFATKNIEWLSHVSPAVSFQSIFHTIEIRVASKRKIKMRNRYQLAIQRDRFPNKFHTCLL
jgi:hypothetical protein